MRFSTYIIFLNLIFLSCDQMLFDPEENSDYFKDVAPGCMNIDAINYNSNATSLK